MASFQKRGNTWQYTISHVVNGVSKPIRKGGFSGRGEAKVAATEIEYDLQRGIMPHLKPEPFDAYFLNWLGLFKANISNNTLERYMNTYNTIQQYFLGEAIQNINKRTYQTFLNDYAKTRAKETTRKLNTHIRACVKEAIDEGIIRIDFTRGAILSGATQAKRPEEKHLNYFESKRLLKELSKSPESITHHLLLLGLTSGMRFAELVGLTRKDFNFKTNEITINKTWGYTKKMHEGFGTTKNDNSNRVIKMDRTTMEYFKALFNQVPDNIHGLVFYSPQSKYKVISNAAANKSLETILKKLKIDTISVHGLRHTHASISLYKKISIYYVSERLGHGDIQTTMDHYAHIIKELREKDERSTLKLFEEMAK